MPLSIIVPLRNEAANMPGLLNALGRLAAEGAQIIVVDGDSSDDSAALARAAGFGVLSSAPGRARQMNCGAAAACGDALLFLHADTLLPEGALSAVSQALQTAHWGRFDVRISGRPWMLRVVAAMMNLRSRLSGIATGDQAIFMRRTAFAAVGGFPEQPLMEDIVISQRLMRLSRPACLRLRAITSGRRWETRGVWRTIFLMWRLRWAYWLGASAEEMARRYR